MRISAPVRSGLARRALRWLAAATVMVAIAAPGAQASTPPGVSTAEAAELTYTSATLKGSVYPGNLPTSYYFEYGPTSAYGSRTPETYGGAGTTTFHASATVSGLTAGTLYHYRLVASNSLGTKAGVDRNFTTRRIPLSFAVAPTPNPVLFGGPLAVAGTLSGTGSAGHPVVLQSTSFPYTAPFRDLLGPILTDAAGQFSFSLPALSENTEFRVSTVDKQPIVSRTMLETVTVRVSLHVRPSGRRGLVIFSGTVAPAEPGALVSIQLLRRGKKPAGLGATFITSSSGSISRFAKKLKIKQPGLYRAMVYVASGANASNHSRPILIR